MSQLNFFGAGLPYLRRVDCPGVLITIEGTDGVGRTSQTQMLREWLELQGHGVVETGWTRSKLIGRTIAQAKQFRQLSRYTYALLYAADFADRLEKEIIPALRAGFVVLADRYVYTAFARDVVRGVKRPWVRDLYGFAVVPHLVLYLKIDVPTLIRRVIPGGVIDYFEAGMDIGFGDDPYDSFKKYQTQLVREYNAMANEFDFVTVSARQSINRIQNQLRRHVSEFFDARPDSPTKPILDKPGEKLGDRSGEKGPSNPKAKSGSKKTSTSTDGSNGSADSDDPPRAMTGS